MAPIWGMNPAELNVLAIRQRRLISFYYAGGERIVEPYLLAQEPNGAMVLLAWVVGGHPASVPLAGSQRWREFNVKGISHLSLQSASFQEIRPAYATQSSKWDNIIEQV